MFTFEPLKDRDDHFGINLDDGDRECFLVCLATAVWLKTGAAIGETSAPTEITYGEAKELVVSDRVVRMSYLKGRFGFTEINVVQSGTGRMVLKFSTYVEHPIELLRLALDLMGYFRSQCESAVETEVTEEAPAASGVMPKFIEFTSIRQVA